MKKTRLNTYWENFWYSEIPVVRPYLLKKTILILVAFDCWILLSARGWHYGLDGFNVAHFSWLDAIQPVPGAELYVGLVLLTGFFSFISAFTRSGRWMLSLIALMYTYGWAMSRIDSYQHHYLISLILAILIFFPRLKASDIYIKNSSTAMKSKVNASEKTSSWAYVLLSVNIGIVYFFTAISKVDSEWISGKSVKSISSIWGKFSSLEFKIARMGFSLDAFWNTLALSIITFEIVLAIFYITATIADRKKNKFFIAVALAGFLIAMCFHIGLEFFELRIGWFSYYMIGAAFFYFFHESSLWKAGKLFTWPERRLENVLSNLCRQLKERKVIILVIAAAVTAVFVSIYAGYKLNLPSALTVGFIAAVFILILNTFFLYRKYYYEALYHSLVISISMALMWGSIAQSDTRFLYYSGLGVYHLRRNELQPAVDNLETANIYENEKDREKQKLREKMIDNLKKQLNKN